MTWWLRFCLGLPARREDIEEIRKSIPEMLATDFELNRQILLSWWSLLVTREFEVDELRRWVDAANLPNESAVTSPNDCPAEKCPLRNGQHPTVEHGDAAFLRLLMAVGGIHKPPIDQFLDLVRRVHKDQVITKVILTDPYIYRDLDERGHSGGYSALRKYLDALGLTSDSKFDLELNPSPKKMNHETAREVFERKIKRDFPHIQIKTFSSSNRFHDRFYLTRDKSGQLSGVFGPSLNGLGANTVVLMGELEKKALGQLGKLL